MRPQWIPALIALSVTAFFMLSRLRRRSSLSDLVKNARAAVSDDSHTGKTLHLNSPIGPIDLQVRPTSDPALESTPKYPGALALDPQSEVETQVHLAGRDGRYIEQGFWTSDSFSVVVAYYQREFPNWREDSSFAASAPGRFRCYEQCPGLIRGVEVRQDAVAMRAARKFREARTVIKYSIFYGDRFPTTPDLQ